MVLDEFPDLGVLDSARAGAARGDRYVLGPDGAPARVVNAWVDRKVHFVDRYATMFATGMKNRWKRRAYVELFAGPGISYNKARGIFLEGSAIRALRREFTDYVFIDIDPVVTHALEGRIALLEALGEISRKRIHVITGDCNIAALRVPGLIGNALPLIFVDPTNWQIRLDTLRRISGGRADLLVTFHTAGMRRMRSVGRAADLDAFFGTPAWRACLDAPVGQVADQLLRLYNENLVPAGYLPNCYQIRAAVRNTRGNEIYELALFSKNELGLRFWQTSLRIAESGQGGFWDWLNG